MCVVLKSVMFQFGDERAIYSLSKNLACLRIQDYQFLFLDYSMEVIKRGSTVIFLATANHNINKVRMYSLSRTKFILNCFPLIQNTVFIVSDS